MRAAFLTFCAAWAVFVFSCAMEMAAEDGGVVVVQEGLHQSYTAINSNGGSPLCTIVNQQCTADLPSARVFRSVRSLAQTRKPGGGVNWWNCPGASAQESTCSHGSDTVWIHNCAGTAPATCSFGSSAYGTEGEVKIAGDGRSAQWFFNNGGSGISNFAGHSFGYDGL